MHVEFTAPDHAAILERLLDGFIQASELLIRAGAVGRPSLDVHLQDDDVPSWQLPTETAVLKTGDCEDLVIWWAGWMRATGKDPRARARIKNVGPKQVHCVMQLGSGKIVDVYDAHLKAQAARGDGNEYAMGGFFGSIWHGIKSGAKAVGHAAESVGHGIKKGAQAVGHAAESTYHGVSDAAHYVAHDLPGAIIKEGASGLADLAHNVGGGVSTVVNAVGDVVAGGLGDALHQVGKAGGAVATSFSSGDSGPDAAQAPDDPAAAAAQGYGEAQGFDDGGGGGGGGGVVDDGSDPWAENGVEEGWDDGDWSGDGGGDGDGDWSGDGGGDGDGDGGDGDEP